VRHGVAHVGQADPSKRIAAVKETGNLGSGRANVQAPFTQTCQSCCPCLFGLALAVVPGGTDGLGVAAQGAWEGEVHVLVDHGQLADVGRAATT
jgi:hypothetical protein